MAIALVWNDAKSFKQHIEQMRMFRQSHHCNLEDSFNLLKNMPSTLDSHSPRKTGGARDFISARGKPTLVPIWEIVPSRGSQN